MTRDFSQIWEMIASNIKDAIIQGALPPGARLKVEEIAARYGVSATPVREAFHHLANLGFVQNIPRRAVIVREITVADLEHLYAVQILLEGLAVRLAVENASNGDGRKLDAVFRRLERALREGNLKKYIQADAEFHEFFLRRSGNPYLQRIVANTRDHIARHRHLMLSVPGRAEESFRQHAAIVAAFKARDPEAGEAAMREHHASSLRLLKERYARDAAKGGPEGPWSPEPNPPHPPSGGPP